MDKKRDGHKERWTQREMYIKRDRHKDTWT